MIDAGSMTERVTILAPKVERNEFGEQKVTHQEVCKLWAKVVFLRGTEAISAGDVWLTRAITVTMRDNKVVTERCRLVWKGKVYKIESLNATGGLMVVTASYMDEEIG